MYSQKFSMEKISEVIPHRNINFKNLLISIKYVLFKELIFKAGVKFMKTM